MATEEVKQQEALERFKRKLDRSINIQRVEQATARDYESQYTPDEYEIIVRVTTSPIEKMDVIESASVLRQHMEDQAFNVDGALIDYDIPPRDRWHTKSPLFYFAVCY